MKTYSGCFVTKGMLLIIIFSLIGVISLGVAAYLFIPVIELNAADNTVETILGDASWFSDVDKNLSKKGYEADITANVPNELTGLSGDLYLKSKILGYGSGDKEVADIDLTFGTFYANHTFGIFYDEDNIAVNGIDSYVSDRTILLPRENIVGALDNSIFHPDSGSDFALDRETYDAICDIFEDSDEDLDEEIEEIFENIRKRSAAHIDTKSGLRFAEGEFALEKRVVCNLDGEGIAAIIDIVVDEIGKNDRISAILEESQTDISELGDKLKDDFVDAEITCTYVIKHGIVSYINSVIKTKNGEYDELLELTVDIESSRDTCLATVICSSEVMTAEGKTNDSFEIKYEKKDDMSLTETSIDISVKNHGQDEQNSSITVNYDKNSYKYQIEFTTYVEGVESCIGISGKLEKYTKKSGLSFTIDRVTDKDGNSLNGNLSILDLNIKENPDAKSLSCPDGNNLFSMTEEEVKAFVDNFPEDKMKKIYKAIYGREVPISEEGILVTDPLTLQISDLMAPLYHNYRRVCTYYSLNFVPRIYIYLESSNVYLFASYVNGNVEVKYSFSPDDTLLEIYHPAIIYNGELVVHQYTLVEEKAADCLNYGYKKWQCALCQHELFTDSVPSLSHTDVWEKVAYTYDYGKTDYDAHYSYCGRCGELQSLSYNVDYNGSSFSAYVFFNASGTVSVDSNLKHFVLPEELYDRYDLRDLRLDYSSTNLLSIRVPDGREVISTGAFVPAENLQVIALPNSIKEIEDGAFYIPSNLHTIFYEGTEEEWSLVKLNGYETEWAEVEVIFLPDGVDDLTVMHACIDTENLNQKLESKKELTANIGTAENIAASNENIELIYDGLVSLAAYDAVTDTIAVAEVGENSTVIRFLTTDGRVKSTIEIPDVISIMDFDSGLLAMGSSSLSTIYFYNIEVGELSSFLFKKYECTFKCLYVEGDRVIFVADDIISTEVGLYSIVQGNECEKMGRLIYHQEIFFFREYHTIIITDWVNNTIVAYNTVTCKISKSVDRVDVSKNVLFSHGYLRAHYYTSNYDKINVYFDVNMNETVERPESLWVELTLDHCIEVQPIFASNGGRATMLLDVEDNILVALATEGSETMVIDYYAEAGNITADGDVILYTPGGYGIILVNTK